MTKTCPLPTPAERRYGAILGAIETEMMQKVRAALQEAIDRAQAEIGAADLGMPPPANAYFAATLHQKMFCLLCDANPDDFSGGKADTASFVIRNMQNVAKHYWGADIKAPPA